MAATPQTIQLGTVALILRGSHGKVESSTLVELAKATSCTVIVLEQDQELEALSEDDMAKAGWCRCPTPGFPAPPAT